MAKKPTADDLPRWGIYELTKRARRIGSVEARDQAHAIEVAIKEYEIEASRRWRLSAQRED